MKRLLLSTALLGAAAVPVMAQDQSIFREAPDALEIRASDFMGMRVYASEAAVEGEEIEGVQQGWEDIGEVGDIVMDREGTVQAVLVDIGGFLGIGERTVAVSMDALQLVSDSATAEEVGDFFLVMNANREALEAAPEYVATQDEGMTAEQAATETEQAIEEGGEEVADAAEEAGEEVVEETAEATEGVENAAEETGEEVADAGEEIADEAADATEEATEETAQASEEAADESADQVEVTTETAEVTTETAAEETETAEATETETTTEETAEGTTVVVTTTEGSTEEEATEEVAAAEGEAMTEEEMAAAEQTSAEEPARAPIEREGFVAAGVEDFTADRLQGAAVFDVNDERVGEVGEILLSEDGQVSDLVIDVGGFLGLGEKPVALPLDTLDILRQDGGEEIRVFVSQSEEELEAMERYEVE